jgi:hypothetical protein
MMSQRNRSSGWKHAKLSGHSNEALIQMEIMDNENLRCKLANNVGLLDIKNTVIGGIKEKNVSDIFGKSTKSKTDLKLISSTGEIKNISIKKSTGGQVYLISVDRFIKGFEYHYSEIPEGVKTILKLMFSFDENEILGILDNHPKLSHTNTKIRDYEKRKKRLVWDSLTTIHSGLANETLNWFEINSGNIADFCFSRGLAISKDNWSDYVWYKNILDGESDIDYIISCKDIASKVACNANKDVKPGTSLGGTTIQFPFGFLQWHLKSMQFHHQFNKINKL